jgi:hypothetical protein
MSGLDDERGICVICRLPIHPGTWRDVLSIDETHIRATVIRDHNANFTFRIYADDSEPQASRVQFGFQELVNKDPLIGLPIEMPPGHGQPAISPQHGGMSYR